MIFFALLYYTNAVVTTIADRIAPYYQPALPDIGHRILPYWFYYQFNNWWVVTSYAFVLIRFIPQADIRVTVFRRWFFVQGLMFGMRSISIYVTSLTVPQPGCITNKSELATPALEAIYVMFGVHATCGDVLFSGHTVGCKEKFIFLLVSTEILDFVFYSNDLCTLLDNVCTRRRISTVSFSISQMWLYRRNPFS